MVRASEIEHGHLIAARAETVWNWASPAGEQRAERRARLIIQAARVASGMGVLELGCGTGLFTRRFAKTGARVTAIDISPELLDQAQVKSPNDHATFCLEDAENLTFGDESFDAVIGSSVLHHLEVGQALTQIHRVLKPGGRIAFAEPNMMNPQIALQRKVPILRRWAGESPEEIAFIRWQLARQLKEAGFANVAIQPFDFLHPLVFRPLIPLVRSVGMVLERVAVIREIAGSLLIQAERGR